MGKVSQHHRHRGIWLRYIVTYGSVCILALILFRSNRVNWSRNVGYIKLSNALIDFKNDNSSSLKPLEQLSVAERYFRHSLRLTEKLIDVRAQEGLLSTMIWRGRIAHQLGDLDLAISSYQRALECDSTSAEALQRLGEIYAYDKPHTAEFLSEAEAYLRKAIEIHRDSWWLSLCLGHVFAFGASYDKALNEVERSVGLAPNAYNLTVLGGIYCRLEKWDLAIGACKKAMEIEYDRVDTLLTLGDAYVGINYNLGARNCWERIQQIAKGSEFARVAAIRLKRLDSGED